MIKLKTRKELIITKILIFSTIDNSNNLDPINNTKLWKKGKKLATVTTTTSTQEEFINKNLFFNI